MSKRILFVDDKKNPAEFGVADCTVVRSAREAVHALEDAEWDVLYLDYYLDGNRPYPNGVDDVLSIVDPSRIPPKVIGISGDPSRASAVEGYAERFRDRANSATRREIPDADGGL